MNELLHTETYCFNEYDNGGETLTLHIKYYYNGDAAHGLLDGIFTNQELTLMSYGNSAGFNLCSTVFTPENLRDLANIMERGYNKALANLKKV